ncbi:MAG TPA: hypothetical protein VJ898_01270 [Natrialbaceae archaeon]|nr:hypothetical protein [Natrialbaceae archaeon]
MTPRRVVSATAIGVVALTILLASIAGTGSAVGTGNDGLFPVLQGDSGWVYVNESVSMDVFLEGDAVSGDPDAEQFGYDVDGVTYLSSGEWMTVGVDLYAPWSGFFSVCVYPWSAPADTTDYECRETDFLLEGDDQTLWIDLYVSPTYAAGDYVFYVYLWEDTGVGYEFVEWVDFIVAVDIGAGTVTPWEPTRPTVTPRPPVDTPEPGSETTIPITRTDGPGRETTAKIGGDGSDNDDAVDRGPDVLHPDNVALLMLVVAIVSLMVQLLRRP